MDATVQVAIVTGICGILAGLLGKTQYDRSRGNGNGSHVGNGQAAVERVLAQRSEVEFQTRMTLLIQHLTDAIKEGHETSAEHLAKVSQALDNSAASIREVHKEIVEHREAVTPAMEAALETQHLVRELHAKEMKR